MEVSFWDTDKSRTFDEREDLRMAIAGIDRQIVDDIMPAKSIYALAGSLAVGLIVWISVFAII
jgi:hypothetical protein